MKKGKKLLAILLSAAAVSGSFALPAQAASNDYKITRIGNKERTVTVGKEFELSVKKVGSLKVKDSQLKWSIKDTAIVGFDDDDRYDDEIELKAKKAGTTTVTCKNLATGGSLSYTVTVKKSTGGNLISRIGNQTKIVPLGEDIELEVKKGANVKDSQIKWTVSDSRILRFDEGDNIGDEVELDSLKTGTVTVTVNNLVTGGKISYIVKVVP